MQINYYRIYKSKWINSLLKYKLIMMYELMIKKYNRLNKQ